MKRMKIVFLVRLYWPHIGGVEKHVAKISEILSQKHEVTVITEQFLPNLPLEGKMGRVNILRIPVSGISEKDKKWHVWKWVISHGNLFKQADIIHAHDVVFWLYPYKFSYLSKPIFTTFHGWEGVYPLPPKNIYQRRLDAWLCQGNICVGDYLAKWYGIRPTLVTYGATDIPVFIPKAKTLKKLLFLGRLDLDTGFAVCVDLFTAYQKKLHLSLSVAGDGPLYSRIPKSAKYLGLINCPEEVLNQYDAVFASGYQSILEAMARKRLVLASYSHALRRDYLSLHPQSQNMVIGKTANEIAQKILYHSPSQIAKMLNSAYHWAENQTWEHLINQYYLIWGQK